MSQVQFHNTQHCCKCSEPLLKLRDNAKNNVGVACQFCGHVRCSLCTQNYNKVSAPDEGLEPPGVKQSISYDGPGPRFKRGAYPKITDEDCLEAILNPDRHFSHLGVVSDEVASLCGLLTEYTYPSGEPKPIGNFDQEKLSLLVKGFESLQRAYRTLVNTGFSSGGIVVFLDDETRCKNTEDDNISMAITLESDMWEDTISGLIGILSTSQAQNASNPRGFAWMWVNYFANPLIGLFMPPGVQESLLVATLLWPSLRLANLPSRPKIVSRRVNGVEQVIEAINDLDSQTRK